MNGNKYVVDTNAVIALLNENKVIESAVKNATWLGVSVISIVEFLSFNNLPANDRHLFAVFLQRVQVINLSYPVDIGIIELSCKLRIQNKLKLPDAVIAASAIINQAVLITNDKQFSNMPNLQILNF